MSVAFHYKALSDGATKTKLGHRTAAAAGGWWFIVEWNATNALCQHLGQSQVSPWTGLAMA